MKHKEWKVGLSLLLVIGITTFVYFDNRPESPKYLNYCDLNADRVPLDLILEFDNDFHFEMDSAFYESLSSAKIVSVSDTTSSGPDSASNILTIQAPDAKADLAKGLVKIYIHGGFISQKNPNSKLMENRYGINFIDHGCIRWYSDEELGTYNKLVFAHLDKEYGAHWRKFLTVATY